MQAAEGIVKFYTVFAAGADCIIITICTANMKKVMSALMTDFVGGR